MKHFLVCLTTLLAIAAIGAYANTEKTVFIAPALTTIPAARPNLNDLNLNALSPDRRSFRLSLPVDFSSDERPHGVDYWYIVEGLNEGQRYEVRICWAAIPTTFSISTHDITHVFDTPELITSLATFSEKRILQDPEETVATRSGATHDSLLFLRVQAAADFFTTNRTLMLQPPAVDIDLILDPYLASVFPQSLVYTAAYVVVLACGGWYLSEKVWSRLDSSGKVHGD